MPWVESLESGRKDTPKVSLSGSSVYLSKFEGDLNRAMLRRQRAQGFIASLVYPDK